MLYPFPSARQPLVGLIFCTVWILCFRFSLEEVLMMWQTKGYHITSPWHSSETTGSTLWREHPKGQRSEGGLLMRHDLDFRVVVSSTLFNLHKWTTAVIIFPTITFSRDRRHFPFKLNQENLAHPGLYQILLHIYIKKKILKCPLGDCVLLWWINV